MPHALIFDFDGVILDTETPYIDAWAGLHAEHGLPADRQRALDLIGHTDVVFDPWEAFPASVDRGALQTEFHRRKHALMLQQPILPGVRDLIAEARERGLRVGVASNSSHAWVDGHLHRLGLYYLFDRVACREDVSLPKPAPDLYQAVVRAWGLAPRRVIAFEDSPPGSAAAQAAGLVCVVAPNPCTAHRHFPHAHRVVASLSELRWADLTTLADRRR